MVLWEGLLPLVTQPKTPISSRSPSVETYRHSSFCYFSSVLNEWQCLLCTVFLKTTDHGKLVISKFQDWVPSIIRKKNEIRHFRFQEWLFIQLKVRIIEIPWRGFRGKQVSRHSTLQPYSMRFLWKIAKNNDLSEWWCTKTFLHFSLSSQQRNELPYFLLHGGRHSWIADLPLSEWRKCIMKPSTFIFCQNS